jgi:NADH dehydrogenase FAD-containing subunit
MKVVSRLRRSVHLLLHTAAFVVSTYAVSNLMPLLLHAAEKGFNASDAALIVGDLVAGIASVTFLAREVYRVDKRAGRIRNRVGWFE